MRESVQTSKFEVPRPATIMQSPPKTALKGKKKSACEVKWEETMSRLDEKSVQQIDAHYNHVLTNYGEGPKMMQVYTKHGTRMTKEEEENYIKKTQKMEQQKREEKAAKMRSKVREVVKEY